MIHRYNSDIIFHSDVSHTLGKVRIDMNKLNNIDMISFIGSNI